MMSTFKMSRGSWLAGGRLPEGVAGTVRLNELAAAHATRAG